ncbi:MAG: pyrimidine 5'-nucleotidase [Anaerolineae bacterium]|nr:pyrimidine 5'-nucleotidase [Anaerolineae bacterium]
MLEYLIFDLDETLYPRQSGLMQAISARISAYMIERMGMDPEVVPLLRQRYWDSYGTTSRGLQLLHGVDVLDYMDYVHDLPVTAYVRPDAALDAALRSLPQRKVVFTNATSAHAHAVLAAVGVAQHFDAVYDVFYAGHDSKPSPGAYRRLLSDLGVRGEACVMIEDTARNLRPAKSLGMVTVLVDPPVDADREGVDYVVDRAADVARVVRAVEGARDKRLRRRDAGDAATASPAQD